MTLQEQLAELGHAFEVDGVKWLSVINRPSFLSEYSFSTKHTELSVIFYKSGEVGMECKGDFAVSYRILTGPFATPADACKKALQVCRERVAELAKALKMEIYNRTTIVSDEDLTEAWGNAQHGNLKRETLMALLEKVAQAKVNEVGKTYTVVLLKLGLIETRNGQIALSNKGLCYLTSVRMPGN